jgi:AcrR family transcriptional regulator
VSPRTADPALRTSLIEAAAHLIATVGPDGLSLRRLATEVGTSTMAIYTHFGSMDEVRRAVRREAFVRFGARLSAVDKTRDPVADLGMLGRAYFANAVANPDLYRAMFMAAPIDEEDACVGLETFDQLVAAVDRCIEAGRFDDGGRVEMARQLWAAQHGAVTLHLVGMLSSEETTDTYLRTARDLIRAWGDDPAATARSAARMSRRIAAETG